MIRSFEELKAKLEAIPDQQMGDPCAICQTGEPYRAFQFGLKGKPESEAEIEQQVATAMDEMIGKYFCDRAGTIYWRIPLEWHVERRGIKRVKIFVWAYCRLFRAANSSSMSEQISHQGRVEGEK